MMATAADFMNKADELFGKDDPKQKPGGPRRVDVEAYLQIYKVGYKIKTKGTRTIYALDACPFDSSHVNNDAAIFQDADGKLGFKCFHDSCQGKGWKDARAAISGDVSLGAFMVGGDGDGEQEREWPDSEPIRAELLPVEALTETMIPEPLLPMIKDVAHRMSVSLDFVAIPLVVVIGSVIGTGCRIRPKRHDDWEVTCNLWGALVGPPSQLKTPAMAEVIRRTLGRLETQKAKDHKKKKNEWMSARRAAKLKKTVLESEYKSALKSERKGVIG
jgi:hypothetical protein